MDLTWDLGDLHIQTEWMFNQQAYTTKGRALTMGIAGTLIPRDVFSWGCYGIVGYRLPWFGIMPYIQLERIHGVLSSSGVELSTYLLGLNIRAVDELVLKVEISRLDYDDERLENVNLIMAQAAWAF